jgi:signal-transduction protein with cAMP-binding, CBS, and nucleotidyltransferase domain
MATTATTVSDFMTRKFETIQEADSVKQAAKKMKDNDISSLVVVDRHSNPIGLVTERDIVRKVFAVEEEEDVTLILYEFQIYCLPHLSLLVLIQHQNKLLTCF